MGDKDNPFENIFGRWGEPFLMPKPSIENNEAMARFKRGDRLITPDHEDVPIPTFRPTKDRIPSFNFDIPKEDMEHFKEILGKPLFDTTTLAPYETMMERVGRQVVSMVIRDRLSVNTPKNLKYPHKRLKKRILKKWAKRFGRSPFEVLFPKVEVQVGVAPDETGLLLYTMSVKPKKHHNGLIFSLKDLHNGENNVTLH